MRWRYPYRSPGHNGPSMRIDVVPDAVLLKERHLPRLGLGAGELSNLGFGKAQI